ncbi:MAG: glycoside hydrolase family 3 N-terminal domain-containing protein [Thermodesulfobacteriota bacterium]
MKLLLAVLKLLIALVLVPLALDWRSPLLAFVRQWALIGLIAVPLVLIFAEVLALRAAKPGERVLKVLNTLGLLLAVAALTATVATEARFQWTRHQVLHADPARLEKLGRHVVVGYQDLSEVKELVRLRAITGVFVSTRNILDKTIAEARTEIQSLQNERQKQGLPPLWVATDQEGGVVSRVSPPLARMPPISEIIERHPDPAQREKRVRQYALRQGRELSALGINLNFAPVVDLNYQIRNPQDRFTRIHLRAISSDPAVVAQVAGWYCSALAESGVLGTLKHFPGLGRVFEDTHAGCATLATPLEELSNTDWVPFRTLMGQGNAFTMLSHVRLAAIDADRPVSISPRVVSGLLRGKWKYDGVLITDDFSMSAVYRSSVGIENGSIDALNAGVDLILISWDADQYYRVMHALLEADRDGKLNPDALMHSHRRLERARQGLSQKR